MTQGLCLLRMKEIMRLNCQVAVSRSIVGRKAYLLWHGRLVVGVVIGVVVVVKVGGAAVAAEAEAVAFGL